MNLLLNTGSYKKKRKDKNSVIDTVVMFETEFVFGKSTC